MTSESEFIFPPPKQATVKIEGGGLFPVRRIFCIGKNYAAHVAEMGGDAKSDSPVFFTKPSDAVTQETSIPYPLGTENLHYEGELVAALKEGGANLRDTEKANSLIFGYAAGCDLTRRDLQAAAKKAGNPWDIAKGFDNAAPVGPIVRSEDCEPDFFEHAQLNTLINSDTRQDAPLADMIWSVPEIIVALSGLFELKAGDLIFTGTPEGVGPIVAGDNVKVSIGYLPPLEFTMKK